MWYQKHISNSACGKMYTRRLFEKVRYPVGRLYEDLGTTYKLFFGTEKVVWSSTVLYFYFHRRESIMNQCFHEKKMDRITVSIELLNWAEKQCKEVLTAAQVRFFVSNMQVLREIPNRDEYRDEIANIRKNIAKYRRKVICNRKAKFLVRVIAVCSVLDMRILQKMGTVYKIVEHRGGKL